MITKLLYTFFLLLMVCFFTSCEMLGDNCQICQIVQYQNGDPIYYGSESEFCGEDLQNIKAIEPVTDGGITTCWECY